MIVLKHYCDIVLENGQAMRIDIPSARILLENVEMLKRFVEKYENDNELSTILEVK